jgi:hypothetical protein
MPEIVPKGLCIKSPGPANAEKDREGQYWGILAIAGDIRLIFMKMHSSVYEAKIGASVEHVEVDGGAGINNGRHCFQNLFRRRGGRGVCRAS